MRGQGGNEHGGSPGFKGGVEPGRAPAGEGRELLTPWGDERVRSLSRRGAVSLNRHKPSSFLNIPAWFKRRSQLRGGWGRRRKGDAPRSAAGALGARSLLPARPQLPRSSHPRRSGS
jgi:hypothetical protein